MDRDVDVLVIGSGVAGCAAALSAARAGARVLLATRSSDPTDSSTGHAQGGIVTIGPGDSPELLDRDIAAAGAGMCNPDATRLLAEEGPPLLERLLIEELGVSFDRGVDGDFDVTEEGAHSLPRILHTDDLTGRAIILSLLPAVEREPNITVRNGMVALDLLNVPDHGANHLDIYRTPRCAGAYCLDMASGEVETLSARQTILATGGLGQLYIHTTNPELARGDGVAMAYRAGARLSCLEFVQFHPTALYHRDADSFLISESVRGEGGTLIDHTGRDFMGKYHPRGSLAPRDVVARAIQNEMLESQHRCVYLDITSKDADWLHRRFPNIHATCSRHGIDLAQQPIPVVPAAHYSCGGVATDMVGQTTFEGLRAVGEVACTGLHGANRLASTSLLEGLLWGWRAGEAAASEIKNDSRGDLDPPAIRPFVPESEPADPALIAQDWLTIRYTMWNYVGLTRTPRRMLRAMSILRELQYEILNFYSRTRPTDSVIGLRNGVTAALAVLFAAQRNHASCGCHYLEED